MPSIRTKKINIEGAEFVIGALTIQQVRDNFTGSPQTVVEAPAVGTETDYLSHPAFAKLFKIICHSLNNVSGYFDDPETLSNNNVIWNKARCIREMDGELFLPLHRAIIEFSGLKVVGETPGEETAASIS